MTLTDAVWWTRQEDFRLMCSNAMAYNRPDTVYYKAARRLMHIGSKVGLRPLDTVGGAETYVQQYFQIIIFH